MWWEVHRSKLKLNSRTPRFQPRVLSTHHVAFLCLYKNEQIILKQPPPTLRHPFTHRLMCLSKCALTSHLWQWFKISKLILKWSGEKTADSLDAFVYIFSKIRVFSRHKTKKKISSMWIWRVKKKKKPQK